MFNNLYSAMRSENIGVEELANILDINRNTMTNKLNGESEFTLSQVLKISTVFSKYNFDYLFTRTKSTAYGLTPQGPVIKRLDTILSELHDDLTKGRNVNTRLNPKSFLNIYYVNAKTASPRSESIFLEQNRSEKIFLLPLTTPLVTFNLCCTFSFIFAAILY